MTALAIIETLTPEIVFAPGGVESLISRVETEVRAIERDISTEEGREAVKSLAYKVARSKTALDELGKNLVSGIKAQAATIDAERRTIRDRLDALKEEVRGPLTAWEDAEAARIAGHEAALVSILESIRFAVPPAAEMVRGRISEVAALAGRDWQEFKVRADDAISDALHTLNAMKANAEQAERDAAELADLRRLKIEREEADRKAAAEAQATEQARLVAAAKAEREKRHAEQIEREKAEAVAAAIERENRRIAEAHAATEAARLKREANARHRAKIHKEIVTNLCSRGFSEIEANNIVSWLAENGVPHVSITY